MKKIYLLPLLLAAVMLGGCTKKTTNAPQPSKPSAAQKLLINELAQDKRPFTVLIPHASNRLFTFYTQNANTAQSASLDLEYQSGELLKAARASIESPIANPYIKAILLGSCSTGGKCTFDTDLKSGTMKFKLSFAGEEAIHVLKGDFTFVLGQKNLPDGRVTFEPTKASLKDNLILANSFGTPTPTSKEIALYPVVISSTSEKAVVGSLKIQSAAQSVEIYDGTSFKPIKYTEKDGLITIALNEKPWVKEATIVRDDQKGATESVKLYLVGPIVLTK